MDDEEFDALVDDATHAVNDLIPDAILASLRNDEHSDLLVRINDALTPILRDLIEAAALTKTQADGPSAQDTPS